jgi:hypothetical protein
VFGFAEEGRAVARGGKDLGNYPPFLSLLDFTLLFLANLLKVTHQHSYYSPRRKKIITFPEPVRIFSKLMGCGLVLLSEESEKIGTLQSLDALSQPTSSSCTVTNLVMGFN